ncbi:unnamed protein product, partial [Prorocentrum cordatum]
HIVSDCEEELLPVPTSRKDCPRAVGVLPPEAASMLVDFEECIVRPDIEFWELIDNSEPIAPYRGRNLWGDRDACIRFVRRLDSIGALLWCTSAKERAAVFCVEKNLRSRVWWLEPVDDDSEAFVSTWDARDACCRFKIDVGLSRYLASPPLRAEKLGLRGAEGEWLSRSRRVRPCFAALPMGLRWSLYFAQEAVTKEVGTATGAAAERRLQTFGWSRLIASGGEPLGVPWLPARGCADEERPGLRRSR